jgi:hypothetical protein
LAQALFSNGFPATKPEQSLVAQRKNRPFRFDYEGRQALFGYRDCVILRIATRTRAMIIQIEVSLTPADDFGQGGASR